MGDVMEWQDISTAPKGSGASYGPRILATDGDTVSGSYWGWDGWRCEADATTEYDVAVHEIWKPTHWMPLPTPPSTEPT